MLGTWFLRVHQVKIGTVYACPIVTKRLICASRVFRNRYNRNASTPLDAEDCKEIWPRFRSLSAVELAARSDNCRQEISTLRQRYPTRGKEQYQNVPSLSDLVKLTKELQRRSQLNSAFSNLSVTYLFLNDRHMDALALFGQTLLATKAIDVSTYVIMINNCVSKLRQRNDTDLTKIQEVVMKKVNPLNCYTHVQMVVALCSRYQKLGGDLKTLPNFTVLNIWHYLIAYIYERKDIASFNFTLHKKLAKDLYEAMRSVENNLNVHRTMISLSMTNPDDLDFNFAMNALKRLSVLKKHNKSQSDGIRNEDRSEWKLLRACAENTNFSDDVLLSLYKAYEFNQADFESQINFYDLAKKYKRIKLQRYILEDPASYKKGLILHDRLIGLCTRDKYECATETLCSHMSRTSSDSKKYELRCLLSFHLVGIIAGLMKLKLMQKISVRQHCASIYFQYLNHKLPAHAYIITMMTSFLSYNNRSVDVYQIWNKVARTRVTELVIPEEFLKHQNQSEDHPENTQYTMITHSLLGFLDDLHLFKSAARLNVLLNVILDRTGFDKHSRLVQYIWAKTKSLHEEPNAFPMGLNNYTSLVEALSRHSFYDDAWKCVLLAHEVGKASGAWNGVDAKILGTALSMSKSGDPALHFKCKSWIRINRPHLSILV